MHELLTQMVMKWARYGPEHPIDAADSFTRLTLDSLAIYAMETRLNSFCHEEMHPFVQAMQATLPDGGRRALRPLFMKKAMRGSENVFQENIQITQKTALDIVKTQRAHPSGKMSLVDLMLNGTDPETGEMMSNESIADNMITLLIAGHETTSGLLSFLFYNFLRHANTFHKAQKEVDEVIGRRAITVDHPSQLSYFTACLREMLRLTPTIAGTSISVQPDLTEDPILLGGSKYVVPRNVNFFYILNKIQKDPDIYRFDVEFFRPDRMSKVSFNKLPKNAWKVFDFRLANPNFKLGITQTLTIKPKDFFLHATLQKGIDPYSLGRMLSGDSMGHATVIEKHKQEGELEHSP
ncbi:MAG: hypothetical protein Q9222_000017 [Ikaeria aurantiellina]